MLLEILEIKEGKFGDRLGPSLGLLHNPSIMVGHHAEPTCGDGDDITVQHCIVHPAPGYEC